MHGQFASRSQKIGRACRLCSAIARVLTLAAVLACSVVFHCQFVCSDCRQWKRKEQRHGSRCTACHNQHYRGPLQTPTLSTEQQVTQNASQLMRALPPHSHHRAPLLHHLSKDLPSKTAAKLFGTSASYVRQVKRKDYTDADLMQDRYVRERAPAKQLAEADACASALFTSALPSLHLNSFA